MKPKKQWIKAEYWAQSTTLELAQSVFCELGAIGIEIDDGSAPHHKKPAFDGILVVAYFEPIEGIFDEINHTFERYFSACDLPLNSLLFSTLEEDDWQGNFVRSCTTICVEPDIFIVPSFEIEAFKARPLGDIYIELDPENAFGTGQHQTTKLCLKSLRNLFLHRTVQQKSHLRCLDVGTGSGILSILLKRLGAQRVLATEVDEDALITAKKNAQKNDVVIDTLLVEESHSYEKSQFDVIVANILASTLITMADNLTGALKENGSLILSGILLEQASSVREVYERLNLRLLKQDSMDDWCALIFKNI